MNPIHPSNIDALMEGQYHFKEISIVSNKNHRSKHFYLQPFFRCTFCIWVSFLCFLAFFRNFQGSHQNSSSWQNLSYHPMQLIGKNKCLSTQRCWSSRSDLGPEPQNCGGRPLFFFGGGEVSRIRKSGEVTS